MEQNKLHHLCNCTRLVSSRSQIECCRFSPTGDTLAACFNDGSVRLYDVKITEGSTINGKLKHHFKEHTSNVWNIAFSTNGAYLASTSSDTTVIVYSTSTLTVLYTLRHHSNTVWGCAYSNVTYLLATCSKDRTVNLHNQETGDLVQSITSFDSAVLNVSFNSTGDKLCTSTSDGSVVVWIGITADRPTTTAGLLIHSKVIGLCKFVTDKDLIACSSTYQNHSITVFNVGECCSTASFSNGISGNDCGDGSRPSVQAVELVPQQLNGHRNLVWSFCSLSNSMINGDRCPESEILISCSGDRTIRCWDLQTGECIELVRQFPFTLEPNSQILSCDSVYCIDASHHLVCVSTYDGQLYAFLWAWS